MGVKPGVLECQFGAEGARAVAVVLFFSPKPPVSPSSSTSFVGGRGGLLFQDQNLPRQVARHAAFLTWHVKDISKECWHLPCLSELSLRFPVLPLLKIQFWTDFCEPHGDL